MNPKNGLSFYLQKAQGLIAREFYIDKICSYIRREREHWEFLRKSSGLRGMNKLKYMSDMSNKARDLRDHSHYASDSLTGEFFAGA